MINLLPPQVKTATKQRIRTTNIIFGYSVAAIVILLGMAAFFTFNLARSAEISDKQAQLDTLTAQKKQVSSEATKLAFIQDRLSAAGQYQEKTDWDAVLNTIAGDTPTSIQLSELKIISDQAKGTSATISGETVNRRDIILFQEKLSAEKNFTNVLIQNMSDTGNSASIGFTIQLTMNLGK